MILVLASSGSQLRGQGEFNREWLALDGRRLVGAIESFDLDRKDPFVRIIVKDLGAKDVKLELLSKVDQAYVRLQQINAEDRQQFELVADHIEALRSTPKSVAGILQQISSDQKLSPYASMWCCIAHSAGDNKVDKGMIACRESIQRINEQRKLDTSRHSRTLSAAYNNLGVCSIKQRDGDAAAKHFVSALNELDYVPPVLAHNISHLLDMKDKPSGLRLEHKWATALQRTMAGRRILEPRKKMQQGWYYSLDLDVPPGLENELSVAGVLPPHPTLELIASGTGIVVAPGYVLTVRSAITHPDRRAFLTTVGIPLDLLASRAKEKSNAYTAGWKQLPVRRLIVTLPEKKSTGGKDSVAVTTSAWNENSFAASEASGFAVATDSTNSGTEAVASSAAAARGSNAKQRTGVANSRTVSNSTNYITIHPKDGPEKELAVLQVDGLRVRPITFSNKDVSLNHAIRVSSFERGPDMLKNGLKVSEGKILGRGKLPSEIRVSVSFSGGQRGAAVYDSNYVALGLACTTLTGKDGIALSAQSIRAWFEQNAKAASLTMVDDDAPTRVEKDIETATVPVFVWGKRSDTELQNPLYNQFFNDNNLIEMHVLRDQFCITCRGRGNVPCIQCKSQGTIQDGMKRIVTGVNPRTGEPIMANVPNIVPCSICKGGRKHVCLICRGKGNNPGGPNP